MGLFDFFRKGRENPLEQRSHNKPAENVPKRTQPTKTSDGRPVGEIMRDYTIRSGDSLAKIARKFYGSEGEWRRIYRANRDQIKDPDHIYPGQKIVIPL